MICGLLRVCGVRRPDRHRRAARIPDMIPHTLRDTETLIAAAGVEQVNGGKSSSGNTRTPQYRAVHRSSPWARRASLDQKAYSDDLPNLRPLPPSPGRRQAENAVRYRQRQKHQGHHQKQFQHATSLIGYAILSGAGSQRHAFSGVSRLPSIIPAQQTGGATTPFKYFAEDKTLAGSSPPTRKNGHRLVSCFSL